MNCAQCNEKIESDPVIQGEEYYCSLECANLAAGYNEAEEEGYFEENDLSQDLFGDYEE